MTYLLTYCLLKPTDELEYFIALVIITYALTYHVPGPLFLNLLTAADIWGLTIY